MILEEPSMQKDSRLHQHEIHEMLMFSLHDTFFINQPPSDAERQFQAKLKAMQALPPSAYGLPANIDMQNNEIQFAWKLATKQLSKMQEVRTPKLKLQQIGKAIEIIQHSFDLCFEDQVTADDLVSILPFLFVNARIERLLAQFLFIDAFHRSESDGDQVEVYLTNLRIVVERLRNFNVKESIK
jgi:hypothetical protein